MLTVLPGILSRYVMGYPSVKLQLHESFTARVIDGLVAGDVDAGIVRDAELVHGLIATPMLSEPFIAVLTSIHPCSADESVSVTILADTPFVYPPHNAGPRAFEKPVMLCEEHGFRPRIAHEASRWLTILWLVGAGLGVSIAPACVRHIAPPGGLLRSHYGRPALSATSNSYTASVNTGRSSTRSAGSRPEANGSATVQAGMG